MLVKNEKGMCMDRDTAVCSTAVASEVKFVYNKSWSYGM